MKKIPRFGLLVALLLVAVLTVAALPAAVLATSHPIPVYGDVTLDGAPAPVGTVIDIYVGADGTPTATTTVATAGEYLDQLWEDDSRHGEALSYEVDGFAATTDPVDPVFGWAGQEVDLTAVSGPQPPQVTTNAATLVTHNSATLNGDLDIGEYTSVNAKFDYGLTTAYGSTSGVDNMGASGAFSASIGGLTPSTLYHYRAVAVTVLPSNSVTDLGGDMTFTTLVGPDWPHDVSLGAGLNVISTPVWLDSASDTVDDIIPTGYNGGYRWTGTSFTSLSTSWVWKPLEAFYVDVDAGAIATFVPTTDMKAPNTRTLGSKKWYLIGSSPFGGSGCQTMDDVLVNLANNWSIVVKPTAANQTGASCTVNNPTALTLCAYEGAFVYVGAGTTRTIVGFCNAPLE